MFDLAMLTLMESYNRWMNDRLYTACDLLTDMERKRDMNAYFRSIHGTLNHLLLVDRLWLSRMRKTSFKASSLDQELYADFSKLRSERLKTDADIQDLVAHMESLRLTEPVTYVSLLRQESVTLPLGLILTHLFNHQTHHRGQVTTLLTQLGYEYGDTDMIYVPGGSEYFAPTH